jgi:hypothetical protein
MRVQPLIWRFNPLEKHLNIRSFFHCGRKADVPLVSEIVAASERVPLTALFLNCAHSAGTQARRQFIVCKGLPIVADRSLRLRGCLHRAEIAVQPLVRFLRKFCREKLMSNIERNPNLVRRRCAKQSEHGKL